MGIISLWINGVGLLKVSGEKVLYLHVPEPGCGGRLKFGTLEKAA